jgi:hypothetical protein
MESLMKYLVSIILIASLAFFTACNKDSLDPNEIEGLIAVQGITTYQYGTHTLTTDAQFFALTSETVDLDQFINQNVIIRFEKISGYPVDGGPDYLEVLEVK